MFREKGVVDGATGGDFALGKEVLEAFDAELGGGGEGGYGVEVGGGGCGDGGGVFVEHCDEFVAEVVGVGEAAVCGY